MVAFWKRSSKVDTRTLSLAEFARSRGLSEPTDAGTVHLPGWVPLLGAGESRRMHGVMTGPLAERVDGVTGVFDWTTRDQENLVHHYQSTIVVTAAPRTRLPRILCNRHIWGSGGLFEVTRFGEGLPEPSARVELESTAFNRRYDLVVPKDHDRGYLRELFSPAFIDWLTADAPDGFAFQVYDGALCGHLEGVHLDPGELDGLIAATVRVAARFREEAGE